MGNNLSFAVNDEGTEIFKIMGQMPYFDISALSKWAPYPKKPPFEETHQVKN